MKEAGKRDPLITARDRQDRSDEKRNEQSKVQN